MTIKLASPLLLEKILVLATNSEGRRCDLPGFTWYVKTRDEMLVVSSLCPFC